MKKARSCAVLAIATLLSCHDDEVDRPVPIAPPGSAAGTTPAARLSELGVFVGNPADQIPRADFHPYDVNVSLYADDASKLRFVYVPSGARIHVTDARWELPVGSYVVKTFFFANPRQLIETRFLVVTEHGLTYSTYVWNDEQTDAFASPGNIDVPVGDRRFHVPGTSTCADCHSGRALGFRSRQRPTVPAELLDDPTRVGGVALEDPFGDGTLDHRARSYLDANCSHCHGPGGIAEHTGIDWNYAPGPGSTPGAVPCRHDAVEPGRPDKSDFLDRMRSDDLDKRMPRGPTRIPDQRAIDMLSSWVAGLPKDLCK